MKKKDLAVLRNKTQKEIEGKIAKNRQGLLEIAAGKKKTKGKNVKMRKMRRRDLAQMLTVVREMEIQKDSEQEKEK